MSLKMDVCPVEMKLEEKLSEIEKNYKKEVQKARTEHYRELYSDKIKNVEFFNETVLMYRRQDVCSSILVNEEKFSYYTDEYSNLSGIFNCFPSDYALRVFADVLKERDKNSPAYKYRTVRDLFINLVRQFKEELTANQLYEILKISLEFPNGEERSDEFKNGGFAKWLVQCPDDYFCHFSEVTKKLENDLVFFRFTTTEKYPYYKTETEIELFNLENRFVSEKDIVVVDFSSALAELTFYLKKNLRWLNKSPQRKQGV